VETRNFSPLLRAPDFSPPIEGFFRLSMAFSACPHVITKRFLVSSVPFLFFFLSSLFRPFLFQALSDLHIARCCVRFFFSPSSREKEDHGLREHNAPFFSARFKFLLLLTLSLCGDLLRPPLVSETTEPASRNAILPLRQFLVKAASFYVSPPFHPLVALRRAEDHFSDFPRCRYLGGVFLSSPP